MLGGCWLSPVSRRRAGYLGRLLLGAALKSLLPLSCILLDGFKRDHRRSIGQVLGPESPHLDQVVDTVTSDSQPPSSVRLGRTFAYLCHASAYNKMESQS
jgi:hypothetical protein